MGAGRCPGFHESYLPVFSIEARSSRRPSKASNPIIPNTTGIPNMSVVFHERPTRKKSPKRGTTGINTFNKLAMVVHPFPRTRSDLRSRHAT